ncbi:hypothetical protein VTN31DRAFT_4916 [Thermomyces dupontii]|uniref:uncharacterized protein n=1 Tax=Talaromyces thermophilus TaxID=28565 RepID=UPI003743578E
MRSSHALSIGGSSIRPRTLSQHMLMTYYAHWKREEGRVDWRIRPEARHFEHPKIHCVRVPWANRRRHRVIALWST